jgi:2,4-dienoyl-CoA reductase-like NADH-dependent reductase (Old Yellow Enzyme family)
LILSEGAMGQPSSLDMAQPNTSAVSAQGSEYPNVPSIYTQEHADAWKKVVDAVHEEKSLIVCQLVCFASIARKNGLTNFDKVARWPRCSSRHACTHSRFILLQVLIALRSCKRSLASPFLLPVPSQLAVVSVIFAAFRASILMKA